MEIRDYTQEAKLKIENRPTWREWLKAAILLGMGVYILLLILTNELVNYINLRFAWLSWVAVVLLLLMGGWALLNLLRRKESDYVPPNQSSLTPAALAITLIPLLFGLLVPPQALSAEAVNGGISLSPVGVGQRTADIPPEQRNILDWLRELSRVGDPVALQGLPVDVIGFVYREPGMTENQFMIARFTMSCCVADAFAIGLPVEYEGADALADGTWIHVRGELRVGTWVNGEQAPLVIPTLVEPTDEPATPYLYS